MESAQAARTRAIIARHKLDMEAMAEELERDSFEQGFIFGAYYAGYVKGMAATLRAMKDQLRNPQA